MQFRDRRAIAEGRDLVRAVGPFEARPEQVHLGVLAERGHEPLDRTIPNDRPRVEQQIYPSVDARDPHIVAGREARVDW
ncbi:MAG: hypothetical protein R3B67_07540 [Phycisphaerales bacterium]